MPRMLFMSSTTSTSMSALTRGELRGEKRLNYIVEHFPYHSKFIFVVEVPFDRVASVKIFENTVRTR